jgi:hypothetical protein
MLPPISYSTGWKEYLMNSELKGIFKGGAELI